MQYLGSKNRISKYLVPIIQQHITDNTRGYMEPFVGGANVIDKIKHDNKIGVDINKYLIALLNKVKEDVDVLPNSISDIEYLDVKSNYKKGIYEDWYVGLVGFCGSFGAKFFGGYARSEKNDKARGKYGSTIQAIDSIRKQVKNLMNIKFISSSFLDLPKDKIKGYVIYCDPPYKDTTRYKTGDFPYEEFYKWCKEMSIHNTVLISEYSMPEEFECIWEKESNLTLNSTRYTGDKRIEKLYIYKNYNNLVDKNIRCDFL